MNKSILIIIAMLFATQSFATNLTGSSASCDSGVLGVEEGGIALRATFEPESIELRWYDNDKNLITVNSASQSCTYGDSITIPTAPARTGYKFNGWKVINIFSTLDTSIIGDHRHGKGESGGADACWYDGSNVICDSSFDDLEQYQWKVQFRYGTIYGDAMCSMTSGTTAVAGTPTNDSGRYCWCQGTGYKPDGSDVIYTSSSPLPWVFNNDLSSDFNCAHDCAIHCAGYVQSFVNYRQSVFGQSD